MRSSLLTLALTAALLSGCLVEEPTAAQDTESEPQAADAQEPVRSAPVQEDAEAKPAEAASSAPHGTPQRTDSAITTGTDPQTTPGGWARKTVTITNGFGEATLGDLTASISAGSIVVRAADRADYLVEAALETRAATEADAQALMERTHFDHSDVLEGSTLFLEDSVRIEPATSAAPSPVPLPSLIQLNPGQESVRVDLVITVPLTPAIALDADASSGDLTVSDLHGPRLELSTSSGDVGITL